jgi:hypothetical protein
MLSHAWAWTQGPTISTIEPALLKNAHAVIRHHETNIQIVDRGRAIMHEHYIVSIMSRAEQMSSAFTVFGYDNHVKINQLNLTIYDAVGQIKKKIKKKDFLDHAARDGISIYVDDRLLYYPIHELEAPFSLEIKVEKELNQLMAIPAFVPIKRQYVSLKNAKLTIEHDQEIEISFVAHHISPCQTSKVEDKQLHVWQLNDVQAFHDLSTYDTPFYKLAPTVDWQPMQFEFGGIKGGFNSWNTFGLWLAKLGAGTRQLPQEAKEDMHRLVDNQMSNIEKIKAVYAYLQERSRYVSIQLGIGGYKPFTAASVHENQYGDCKALSNYTQALLEEVGVQSYYTIIHAGEDGKHYVDPTYPTNSFNHAVLIVPLDTDTILLECTSQNEPCGFRGAFTDGRYALAIADDGGHLIKTPSYSLDENVQVDSILLTFDENNGMQLHSRSRLKGLMADIHELKDYPESDQRKYLSDQLSFGQFDIRSHDIQLEDAGNWNYQVNLQTKLFSNKFANKSGSRFFIPLAIFHSFGQVDLPDSMQYEFNLNQSYQYMTHVALEIPDGYGIESEEISSVIEKEFGRYTIQCHWDEKNNKFYIDRRLVILEGHYPKELFLEYKEFRKEISKIERDDIVLIENE